MLTQSLVLLSALLHTYVVTVTCAIISFATYVWWHNHLNYCQLCYIPMITQSLVLLSALLHIDSDSHLCLHNHLCYYKLCYIPMVTQSLVLLSALLNTNGETINCAIVSFATYVWWHSHLCYCQLCYIPMATQSLVLLLPTEAVPLSWSHSLQDVCASWSW